MQRRLLKSMHRIILKSKEFGFLDHTVCVGGRLYPPQRLVPTKIPCTPVLLVTQERDNALPSKLIVFPSWSILGLNKRKARKIS